ncbi:MAG: hypothetical protein OXB88_01095, partial [Bacteriovoracales bacterium]|nr:hypothetical protein [Bacteriovoracales bacterium]
LIVLTSYESFLGESVKVSFTVSEAMLKKSVKTNNLVRGFHKAREVAQKEIAKREKDKIKRKKEKVGWWDRLVVMAKVHWNDGVTVLIWLLVYMAFLMLKLIYTTTFYLLYVFLSIQAVAFIFPPTASSLKGAFKTYLTLMLSPLVMTVILIILGHNVDYVSDMSNYTFSENLQGLVQLLLAGILLLFSQAFASSLLDGRGTALASNRVIQVASTALMTAGVGGLMSSVVKLSGRGVGRLLKGAGQLFRFPLPSKFSSGKGTDKRVRDTKAVKEHMEKGANFFQKRERQGNVQDAQSLGSTRGKRANVMPTARSTGTSKQMERKKRMDAPSQRAKELIELSKGGNLNLNAFRWQEKKKAVEMARSNPRANFIRKSTYFQILSELSRPQKDGSNEEKEQRKRLQINRRKKPQNKRRPNYE